MGKIIISEGQLRLIRESLGKIKCKGCGWEWKKSEGGKDKYKCHKCGCNNDPNNEFAEVRMGGVEKIVSSSKKKGGLSMLTYHHFKVKIPYYKRVVDGKFNIDEAQEEYDGYIKELVKGGLGQVEFQRLVGKIEVLGELLIKYKK